MTNNNDTDSTTEQPLVTFAIIAFNQEEYIRAAVEGAFAQTYSPLEIVVSDDCSTDKTYDIICEMAENYTGDHIVRTHRPKEFRTKGVLGLLQHVNH